MLRGDFLKISEVCDKTGLTRRTIRFYEEKGLISPKSEDKNGKSFREYGDDDVKRLKAVADLRRLEFSIEEINEMIDSPENIGRLVKERKAAIAKELSLKKEIYSVLSQLEENAPPDIFTLSSRAGRSLNKLPVKDIEPDFSKFETLTLDEKQKAVKRFHDSMQKKALRHKRIKLAVFGFILPIIIVFIKFIGFSFIPKSIDVTASGSYDGENAPDNEVITVKGKLYEPILFEPFFVGDVTFSQKDEYNIHTDAYIYPSFFSEKGTEGFFYELNEDKNTAHPTNIQGKSMNLYISSAEDKKNNSRVIDLIIKNGDEITVAFLTAYSYNYDGELYRREELTFRPT